MTFRPAFLTYDNLRAEADEFVAAYHPSGTQPIPIEQVIEFDLSMDVIPVDGLKTEIGVDAFLTNDLEKIYVDDWVLNHAPVRYRFSLAHEAAHYWLHDALYQESSIKSLRDWSAVQDALGETDYRWFEWQANNFAGFILVPGNLLKPAFTAIADRLVDEGIPLRRIDHHPTRAAVIRELARQFAVSEQTMEIRLERDGLLAKLTPDLLRRGG
jgi:hypothetical protein